MRSFSFLFFTRLDKIYGESIRYSLYVRACVCVCVRESRGGVGEGGWVVWGWVGGVSMGVVGACLAVFPLLPVVSHWRFFSQTGICIPLPFHQKPSSSADFSYQITGYEYAFGVMIVLNFVLFLAIAVGQALVYWSVQVNTMTSTQDSTSRDSTIARRLTTIAVSDFLCWFPVGLCGLLAFYGVPISGEVNVAVAIFVLPFNAAFNPFLYTFNVWVEKRRKHREAEMLKKLTAEYQTELST